MLHRPTTSGNEYIHRIINISEYTPADTSMSLFLFIGTARIVCAARSMQRVSVHLSQHGPQHRTLQLKLGRKDIDQVLHPHTAVWPVKVGSATAPCQHTK